MDQPSQEEKSASARQKHAVGAPLQLPAERLLQLPAEHSPRQQAESPPESQAERPLRLMPAEAPPATPRQSMTHQPGAMTELPTE